MKARTWFSPEGYIVFSVLMLMASVYLLPNYTDNIFRALFIVAFLFSIRILDISAILSNPIVRLILALIAYTTLSSVWAHDSGKYAFAAAKDGAYLIIGLFVVIAATSHRGAQKIFNLLMLTSISCSALVVGATFVFASSDVITALSTGSRLTHWSLVGMAKNPIHSGFFIGLGTLFSIHFYRSETIKWRSIMYLLLAFSLGGFVFLTKSRGAIVFLAISASLLIWLVRPRHRQQDIWLISIGAALLGTIFIFKHDMLLSRFGGESIRMEILKEYTKLYLSSPWFGIGWSEEMSIVAQGIGFSKPHNSFFHVLVTGGIVGFSIFSALTLHPLWYAIRSKNSDTIIIGLWLLFGCLYIAVDGRYPIRQPSSQWLYYWMPVYLIISQMIEYKSTKTTEHSKLIIK